MAHLRYATLTMVKSYQGVFGEISINPDIQVTLAETNHTFYSAFRLRYTGIHITDFTAHNLRAMLMLLDTARYVSCDICNIVRIAIAKQLQLSCSYITSTSVISLL